MRYCGRTQDLVKIGHTLQTGLLFLLLYLDLPTGYVQSENCINGEFPVAISLTTLLTPAVQWRLFSTVKAVQYSGGLTSVLWRANISTVEVVQYSEGLTSVQ